MTVVERARLKPGQRLCYKGLNYTWHGYRYRAHGLKQEGVSELVTHFSGVETAECVWLMLSNEEILDAERIMEGRG